MVGLCHNVIDAATRLNAQPIAQILLRLRRLLRVVLVNAGHLILQNLLLVDIGGALVYLALQASHFRDGLGLHNSLDLRLYFLHQLLSQAAKSATCHNWLYILVSFLDPWRLYGGADQASMPRYNNTRWVGGGEGRGL